VNEECGRLVEWLSARDSHLAVSRPNYRCAPPHAPEVAIWEASAVQAIPPVTRRSRNQPLPNLSSRPK
jgi:hypothetical protein